MKEFKLWKHQEEGIEGLRESFSSGHRRMCFVAPPGAGKSLVMREIILPLIGNGKRVNIYLNRRMLTSQTMTYYTGSGIRFGVVAADHPDLRDPGAPLQICSIQTVASRKDRWDFEFPDCDFFLVDEKHQQVNAQAESVFARHIESGAVEIAFTATPTTLTDSTCDDLIVPTGYAGLVETRSHLPVHHYAPDMPDVAKLGADVSEGQSTMYNEPAKVIGNVFETWQRLNPEQLPAILFAPSVAASAWYTEQFIARGVPAAHIDASKVITTQVINGKLEPLTLPSDSSTRQEIMDGSESGKYKVVSNRFVLREAIDMKWLYHGICATTFSSLASFLQASGRVLRYTDLYDHVIWQDHGANLHRWGFINDERTWEIGKGNSAHYAERKERGEKADAAGEVEPIACPKCDYLRTHGTQCPSCGHVHKMTTRKVREADGTLKLVRGRFFKKAREKNVATFVKNSLYMHRAICRKNRTCHSTKTLHDVAVNAVTRAEREGVEATYDQAMKTLLGMAKVPASVDSNFMQTFFPKEKRP